VGYETKLLIGRSSDMTDNEHQLGQPEIDCDTIYKPYLKDDKGNYLLTGRKRTWFQIYATLDLCKCGGESSVSKIEIENKDELHFWYWYSGSDDTSEDCYGTKLKPVPIKEVVDALREDVKESEYRRFKWALALLEAMQDDSEGLSVLLYGH